MLAQTQSRTDDRRLTATFLSIRSSPPLIRHSRRSLAHRAASPPPASPSPSSSPPFTRLSLRVGTDGGWTGGRTSRCLKLLLLPPPSLRHRQRRQRRSLSSSSSRPALTPAARTGCDMASCIFPTDWHIHWSRGSLQFPQIILSTRYFKERSTLCHDLVIIRGLSN